MENKKYEFIYRVPLSMIDDFENNPFKVRMDEDMQEIIDSIKSDGLQEPLSLRKKDDGRYEIISGHRRKKACEILGIDHVRAWSMDITRDEAVIALVNSNLQRSKILPSERAWAYKMKMEAKQRQGSRADLTSGPLVQKLTRELLGDENGEGGRQISRYIRLTKLRPEILDMVDEGKMGMRPAVEISYLTDWEQDMLSDVMKLTESTPTHSQAKKMRELSKEEQLDYQTIDKMLREDKPNQKEQIRVRYELAKQYLPPNLAFSDAERYILIALEHFRKYLMRNTALGSDTN